MTDAPTLAEQIEFMTIRAGVQRQQKSFDYADMYDAVVESLRDVERLRAELDAYRGFQTTLDAPRAACLEVLKQASVSVEIIKSTTLEADVVSLRDRA